MLRRFAMSAFPALALAALLASPAGAVSKSRPAAARAAADPLAPPAGGNSTERRFWLLVSDWTRYFFAARPGYATMQGIHRYDSQLGDYSRAAIDGYVARARRVLADLKTIDRSRLTASERIDFDLFQSGVEGQVFDLTEIRRWENDPSSYNYAESIYGLVARTYGTPRARLTAVISRLNQVPRFLEAGKRNLVNPPELFTRFAGEDFEGTIEFLDKEIPPAFASVKDRALWARYNAAKKQAVDATKSFIQWMQADLLPRSHGSYVLGEERYRKKLLYEEMVDIPLDSLLATGERELQRLEARYAAAAAKIHPGATLEEVTQEMRRDHPTAAGLIPYAEGLLEAERSYAISSHFIDVPSEVRCKVRPTPSFDASRSFASLDSPGPFEKEANEAYYNITVPEADWDSAHVEQHLQGFSHWTLPSVSLHEAYPGHYVHFLYSKRAPGLVRKTMGCGSMAEGWAFYCEEGMLDHGYRKDDPKFEFGVMRWALVRACRFQVGIRVHTRGMTMDQAIAYFVDHAHMERANAEREAYRAAFDPTYIVYMLGALQIRKLRDDVARAEGAKFDLARFHASLLSEGALPVALLRRILLNDSGPSL